MINPPLNVTATRVSFNSVNVTWTAPAVDASSVLGYEVFYQLASSNSGYMRQTVNANSETLQIDNLAPERTYSIFVVAFGGSNTIPSERSNLALVPPGK